MRRVYRARVALLAVGLGASPATTAPIEAQVIRAPEVRSLSFQGNETFSDSELRAIIETRRTECVSFLLTPFCALTDWGFAHRRGYLDSLDVAGDALRLRTYYRLRGFFESDVQHLIRTTGSEARVGFVIDEGPPTSIDTFRVTGLPPTMSQATASRLLAVDSGDRFDQLRLEAGKDSLVRSLRQRGYIEALVFEETSRETNGPAHVSLEVSPGPRFRVGEIRLEGADAIGEEVVRALLTIRPGQYYDQRQEEESQRLLFGLDAIRFASISRERPGGARGDSIVDLRVVLTPAQVRAARGGIGGSTDECLQTEATLTHRNLFGGAKRLSVTARLKNIFAQQLGGAFPCSDVGTDSDFRTLNYLLQAELFVPVFLSGRNSFRATVFGERETVPDVFIREGVGADLSVTRRLNRRMTATFGYEPEFTGFAQESADIFFCVNFGFCAPEDIATVTQARWLAPLSFGWVFTGTNDPLQPTDGFYMTAELENAGTITGSAYRYVRGTLQLAGFAQLDDGLVLAGRTRFGVVEPTRGPFSVADPTREQDVIHPAKRFFAGGSQSIRGFGQNLLGPRVLVADQIEDCATEALLNCVQRLAAEDPGAFDQRPNGGNASFELSLELRETLSPRWGFVLFLDTGNVWEDLSNLEAPIWTPGAGIRFRSPIGPIRLDVGYDPTGPTQLPVVVSLDNGTLIELDDPVVFDPFTFDDPSLLREILRRFQFHISIGEAF
ncbi:MAG: BamA/TamA family outer membrane protein [Gemmatimonadetes bacterium]|nr:BamA/TamA family outer membrane protein [Gemmatimonadota bacterium]